MILRSETWKRLGASVGIAAAMDAHAWANCGTLPTATDFVVSVLILFVFLQLLAVWSAGNE